MKDGLDGRAMVFKGEEANSQYMEGRMDGCDDWLTNMKRGQIKMTHNYKQ